MSDQSNPFKTTSSSYVYKNPWIKVREDQIIRPDGSPGIYGVIEFKGATAVLALTEENEILLVGQYRYPTKNYSWEIIEGGRDEGESFLEAAKRELAEEAALTAEEWIEVGGTVHLSNSCSDEAGKIFIARKLSPLPATKHDVTEVLQIKKVPIEDFFTMTQNGEITDSLTLIGAYWLKVYREKNDL